VLERRTHPLASWACLADTLVQAWLIHRTPTPRAIDATTAYLTTANLLDVVRRGTGKAARKLPHPVAGKTGTLPYDVWFAGFTGQRVAVAWLGADRRERPLGLSEAVNKVHGADTALPMWLDFMKTVDVSLVIPELPGDRPADVVRLRVDPANGLLAPESARIVPHRKGTEPKELSTDPLAPPDGGDDETEF
jgi:membrane carboxypeptidase/penicillin-binding protein